MAARSETECKAQVLVEEISLLADRADKTVYWGDISTRESAVLQVELLRDAISRIGRIADIACHLLGGDPTRADEAAWLLPPVYKVYGVESTTSQH